MPSGRHKSSVDQVFDFDCCLLQQSEISTKFPFLLLSLTGNQRCLYRQWCDVCWAWTTEWNDIVFTDESRFCLLSDSSLETS
ncbi:hypothetical protein TNCV_4011371 [Trichonephila clavipes]|nr:hypothetical protein TNCV_4011371 [Trichonephila clavipes]